MGGPHVRLIRSNSTLFIPYKSLKIAPWLLAKFMFPTIASSLRIGPYLFYIEKFTTQFNTTEKNW